MSLFGESHGTGVGVMLDGLAPGIPVSEEVIAENLRLRRPSSSIDTPRQEKDEFQIVSGVFNGHTTGTPLVIVIPNENTKSSDYTYGVARPSHADYTAWTKYHGFEDYRGGGHFSGRITAAIVAAGGVIIPALHALDIRLATHILQCASVHDAPFTHGQEAQEIAALKGLEFPVLDASKEEEMRACIDEARKNNNSVGGITQTAIVGVPAGLGEPWFDALDSMLAHALFSIGGIKGVNFGAGVHLASMLGSEANDAFYIDSNNCVQTKTNNSGGIQGGISNGAPILFDCVIKPTASISKAQETIDFIKRENTLLELHGRHDPAIVRRACHVVNSMAAFVVADALAMHFGTDYLAKKDA